MLEKYKRLVQQVIIPKPNQAKSEKKYDKCRWDSGKARMVQKLEEDVAKSFHDVGVGKEAFWLCI